MDTGIDGILILSLISIVFAVLLHMIVKKYIQASLIAGIMSAVLFIVVDYIHMGYLDPFFPFALITSSVIGFIISLVVGIPFKRRRSAR